MEKFEYLLVKSPSGVINRELVQKELEVLNKYGEEGWQLQFQDNGYGFYVFMRRKT